jgi:dTDP-4-dehydrorhamnose 3,5-epimerase
VIYDDRESSASCGEYQVVTLSRDNFCRLTVPPMVWMGFQGMDVNTSMLLNIADIEHSPAELDRKELNAIKYNWQIIE